MFIKVLKGETTIVPESRVTLNIIDKLYFFQRQSAVMYNGMWFRGTKRVSGHV
jgi:hypothetical protein